MKQQKNSQITLDEFENISLWQLLPCGDGRAIKKLRSIVNSVLHGQAERGTNKPLSVLITGNEGKRTHACCFLKALGNANLKHIHANLLQTTVDVQEHFHTTVPDTGYVISSLELLPTSTSKKIYQALTEGEFRTFNASTFRVEGSPVFGSIVCTAKQIKLVPSHIRDSFDYHVELMTYTDQQKELIALQRLKYANIEIENEDVLRVLMLYSPSELFDLVKLLKLSIVVMMGEGRNVLRSEDVRKGKELW